MNNRQVLLVDDNQTLGQMYALTLSQQGYHVTCLESGAALLGTLSNASFEPDLLILDVQLPDIDGLDLLVKLKESGFNAPVIIITGHGSIDRAVEAMQRGAANFLVKPFPVEHLAQCAQKAFESLGLSKKAEMIVKETHHIPPSFGGWEENVARPKENFGGFIGLSKPMRTVYDIIENAAQSNATVFITGESGTGKDVCAEALHKYSPRAKKPFVAVNCAAIPRDLLESELFGHVKGAFTGAMTERMGAAQQAHGGTLFLDEIAEIPIDMQTKLLRFLQNFTFRKVGGNREEKANIRLICATNRDPLEEIKKGTLRQDLYYRLHVIPIHMPPLRTRKNDITDLADYFLKIYAREERKNFTHFTAEAEGLLRAYDWPGNVRELQNTLRGITALHQGRFVTAAMLPHRILQNNPQALPYHPKNQGNTGGSPVSPLWVVEKTAIEHALSLCDGNIPRAAAMLEISPSTIYRKKMAWEDGSSPSP